MPEAGDGMTTRLNHSTSAVNTAQPARGKPEKRGGIEYAYVKNFAINLVKPTTTDLKVK
jgi:hypothetical protein